MAHHKRKRKHPTKQTVRSTNDFTAQRCNPEVDPDCEDMEVEHYFAVEWGERLESSKAIARGGKCNGYVPGATGQFP